MRTAGSFGSARQGDLRPEGDRSGFGQLEGAPPTPSSVPAPRLLPIIRWTFLLFVFSVPFDMVQLVGGSAATKAIGYIFLASILLQPSHFLRRLPAGAWWIGAYVLALGLWSVPAYSVYPAQVAMRLLTLGQLYVMLVVSYQVMTDERMAQRAIIAFGLACFVISFLMMAGIGVTMVGDLRGVRTSFAGQNPNALAVMLSVGMLGIIGLAFGSHWPPRAMRWALLIGGPVVAYGVMQTGSRAGLTTLLAGVLALVLERGTVVVRVRNIVLTVVFGGLLLYAVDAVDISRFRWERTVRQGSLSGREVLYPIQLLMIAERPALGYGPEENRRELARRAPFMNSDSLSAHNLYLGVLTEMGFVGSLPLLIALGYTVQSVWRARRTRHGVMPVALLAALLVANLTSSWMVSKTFWFMVGFFLASGQIPITMTAIRQRRPRYAGRFAPAWDPPKLEPRR